jgi:transcriptional regulator with XRE-family HTH domain
MSGKDSENKQRSLLSRALRAVRAIRKVKPRVLAEALGLSLRGYQNFEAGGGQLNIDHVMAFARANDADPIGILAAVQIGKPEFAAWVAQNKAMIAFMITLQEFAEDTGEAMTRLETTTWVSAYREMFKGLSERALASQAQDNAWLTQNAARLGLGPGHPSADKEGVDEDDEDDEDPEAPRDDGS